MAIKIGLVTDVQYSNLENVGLCHYRKSLDKLKEAIDYFNSKNLDFVIQLGDFIDQDWDSYHSVFEFWQNLEHKSFHVLGNHDYNVEDNLKSKVPKLFGLKKTFYSFFKHNWQFIFLDGNDISLSAYPKNSKEFKNAERYLNSLSQKQEWWNGAIGDDQLNWLEKKLSVSKSEGHRVAVFCHFPIYPKTKFCLWNHAEVMGLLLKYSCVKAWMNGHHHVGSYCFHKKIHFVTFQGMVDLDSNSFGILNFENDNIIIQGFGREVSRTLNLK